MATWQDVVALGLRLPEAAESTTYRQPALKVRGRTFAWLSPHEDGALVLRCDLEERAVMIESQPEVFWTTPHYAGHPMVLVHLDAIGDDELLDRIAESWLLTAPPRLAATLAPAEDQEDLAGTGPGGTAPVPPSPPD